jgi:hypothetical protein
MSMHFCCDLIDETWQVNELRFAVILSLDGTPNFCIYRTVVHTLTASSPKAILDSAIPLLIYYETRLR